MAVTATPNLTPNMRAAEFLLERIFRYSEGQIEIRCLPNGKRRFFATDDFMGISAYVTQSVFHKQNVYFGIATRDGKGGSKRNIVNVPALWVDVDFKDTPRKKADSLLQQFTLQPSAVIMSGNGYHLYWLLKEPAESAETRIIENTLRTLAVFFDGDPAVAQSACILRVPGTYNFKYDRPVEVALLECENREYLLEDFEFLFSESGDLGVDLSGVSAPATGQPVEPGGRNRAAASLTGQYIIDELSLSEIKAHLDAWNNRNPTPLSQNELNRTIASVTKTHLTNNPSEVISLLPQQPDPEADQDADFTLPCDQSMLFDPPGIIKDLSDWITNTANRPQPHFSLLTAIATTCAAAGNKYETPSGIRANFYGVCVGSTGCGKDHPRKMGKQLLISAGIGERIGGDKIASGQGLLGRLGEHPVSIFFLDEFGLWMQSLANPNTGSHVKEIATHLMELTGAAGSIYHGTEYADRVKRARRDINYPCCILNATTTPETFYEALKSTHVVSGYLNRMLVLETDNDRPACTSTTVDKTPPSELIDWIRAINAPHSVDGGGNLEGYTDGTPYRIPMTNDADRLHKEFDRLLDSKIKQIKAEDDGAHLAALYTRGFEQAARIAIPISLGVNPVKPVIDAEVMAWCINFVSVCSSQVIKHVQERVADSEFHSRLKAAYRAIKDAGPGGMTKTQICRHRAFARLNPRERKDVLNALIEESRIQSVIEDTKTKKRHVYVASKFITNNSNNSEIIRNNSYAKT